MKLAENGWEVTVHEAEYVVGGHVRTAEFNGIMYEQNAVHISHTDSDKVIEVLNKFSTWLPYEHILKTQVPPGLMHFPPQIDELKTLKEWPIIEKELSELPSEPDTTNFETYAISIMGKTLYNWFILPYTQKQWGTEPKNLSSSFAPKRIDFRTDGYLPLFRDKWQAFPEHGWTKFIENMLSAYPIKIWLGKKDTVRTVDWDMYDAVVVTAPLDDFLETEQLPWRGVRVEHEYIPNIDGVFLPAATVNHPGLDKDYTRRTETKWMSGQNGKVKGTIVTHEYPGSNDKHYPIDDVDGFNRKRASYLKKKLIQDHPNAITAGRLANYVYINTDQAIMQGLNAAEKAMNIGKNE
jgi:UDP-galactopyranose mutase